MISTIKLTRNQKIAIAAVAAIIILALSIFFISRGSRQGNYNNTIKLAKTYADRGEYDRALSLLDKLLLKNPDSEDVLSLFDDIILQKQAKENLERGVQVQNVPLNSNVTVDIDTDGITNAMQDSISSMQSALERSNREAEESRRALAIQTEENRKALEKQAEENRKAMESLMKFQEEQKNLDQQRRERESQEAAKRKIEEDTRKAEAAAAEKQKKLAEEKQKAKEAENAKKNAEIKKTMDKVNEEIKLGKAALAMGNIEEAIKHFQKADSMIAEIDDKQFAAEKKSEVSQYLIDAAENSTTKENKKLLLKEAFAMAQKTLSENPNDPTAHYILAQDAINNKNWQQALAELTKAAQNDPDNYLYYYEMGKVQYNMKKFNEALVSFNTACEKNNKFAPSRYNMGLTYLKLNKEADALNAFRKAIDINPRYEKAYLDEARLLVKRNDYSGAITSYSNVLKINNRNTDAIVELGSVYYVSGKYSSAEERYRNAISLLPPGAELSLTKYNLSTVLLDSGKIAEAEKFGAEAYEGKDFVKNEKSRANIVYNYALILDRQNKVDKAIPLYREVLKLNPEHNKTKINLAVMYMGINPPEIETALTLLLAVFESEPKNFEANNNLGSAYVLKGEYGNAIKFFKNALEFDPKNTDVRINLAKAYVKNGQYETARDIYVDLLRKNMELWDVYIELAKVCLQLNQSDIAEGYLLTVKQKKPDFKTEEVDSLLNSF